ncbi:AI-2E family transporter [Pisciglobus halotolerans]|uniref:Predicted PurR-regulated permease PerM n=1 Tax=Pisciglobus halotolerans TaxID=745365 RepID=A0A1I3C713_9LACT|nr:AI-2E family transporter [Pisciglobus halotolerans]SFH70307.1 Predicted PurR-regulated permease PerM [Pisciglobus halotolerans]
MENPEKKIGNRKAVVGWFKQWVLNNKAVAIFSISLLILLNILVFSKVSYILNPVRGFFEIVGLPVILSAILYYLLNPVIDWLEKKKVPRVWGITIVFIVIVGLLIWGITTVFPFIRNQIVSLVDNWPDYWKTLTLKVEGLIKSQGFSQLQIQWDEFRENLLTTLTDQGKLVLGSTFDGLGNFLGTVTSVVIAIVTMPFILFYLLRDGRELPNYLLKFVPTRMRSKTYHVMYEMNMQVSQYVRGQLVVAFFVGMMFWIGFSIIGLDYAASIGTLAGFLNLIPYLGSFLATIPAIVVGLVDSPAMFVKVILVFGIEQLIEGRVIQPQILGSTLKIHPITILFVLLTAGKLFGVTGVLIGIPGYAILKIIVTHIFKWYKDNSNLYQNEESYQPAEIIQKEKKQMQNNPDVE